MNCTNNLRNLFVSVTMLVLGTLCIIKSGTVNMHSIFSTFVILIPAMLVMGFLGQKMGEIVDNPRNRADADYKLAVLNALKKMDKSMTLQDLNEKLTTTVAEPDSPDSDIDDLDV
ncbi:MAG: hypothetical protein MJ230_02000 [bacterium]|nr:hypothetical protein [bacterium]